MSHWLETYTLKFTGRPKPCRNNVMIVLSSATALRTSHKRHVTSIKFLQKIAHS